MLCTSSLVPVFSLAADVADGLVDQNRDLQALLLLGLAVNVNACIQCHRLAHHSWRAINPYPTTLNPGISLTPGAQAQLSHALV